MEVKRRDVPPPHAALGGLALVLCQQGLGEPVLLRCEETPLPLSNGDFRPIDVLAYSDRRREVSRLDHVLDGPLRDVQTFAQMGFGEQRGGGLVFFHL